MDKTASLCYGFLSILFDPYPTDEGLTVEVDTLDGPEPPDKKQHWFGITPAHLEKAAAYCARHRDSTNVFMGVLPREGRTDRAENCPYTSWLWCDIDCGNGGWRDPTDLLRKACTTHNIPDPTLLVCSGLKERENGQKVSGMHCYWKLETVEPLHDTDSRQRFKEILKRLCHAIGGEAPGVHADSSAADIRRILRPNGTINHKNGERRPVIAFLGRSAVCKGLDWWESHLPPSPAPTWEQKRVLKAGDGRPNRWKTTDITESRWATLEGYREGERHRKLLGAGRWMAEEGIPPDVGREVIARKAANSPGSHPVDAKEIDGMVTWGWRI